MLCPSPEMLRSWRAARVPMAECSAVVRSMIGTPARIGGMPSSPVTMAMPDMVWPIGS